MPRQEPRNRADEIITRVDNEYKRLVSRLKPDQSINMICTIGGRDYDVFRASSPKIDIISVDSRDDDGNFFSIIAPVEQIFFTTMISKKINDEPPREIGFHAIRESESKNA